MLKKFVKKYGFALFLGLLSVVIISLVITININNLIEELQYEMNYKYHDKTSYISHYHMIGYSDANLFNKPVSAVIENGILKVKGKLTNNTGKNLKLTDYGIISFGGYDFAGNYKFDKEGTLNNEESIEISFEANISTFKNINIIPTTIHVELGTYDLNNNYKEYNLKYVVSWNNA